MLDLNLPDAHGFQTFALVCQEAPNIPILLMTGFDDRNLATEVVRHGAQDYLVKGQFDASLLIHAIRYAIERKRAEGRIQNLLNDRSPSTGWPMRWVGQPSCADLRTISL